MNVLRKFTWKSLLRNPVRTLVTVAGILLSAALFTAVAVGGYSGLCYLRDAEIDSVGAFHAFYPNLTPEQAAAVEKTDGVESAAGWREVGWAEFGGDNPDKPYLLVEDMDPNLPDLLSIRLTDGRLPQADGELLLPTVVESGGGRLFALGDTLTLDLRETPDGEVVEQKTYTVVGFYKRLNLLVEDYDMPGFTAFTVGGGRGTCAVFFTVEKPSKFYEYMPAHALDADYVVHQDLLRLSGSFRTADYTRILYSFAGILLFLVALGSVSLIYNAFSISVGERTRQFGILKSVGATNRQIRASVLWEAFLLCAFAIPLGLLVGCVGIGLTLHFLQDDFARILGDYASVRMKTVIHPLGLLLAAGLGVVTTLISAAIPARRAMKQSAIDAIRQAGDVKLQKRDVRSMSLTEKLFGLEGMLAAKNFRRSRKRYRAVVLSLSLSVVLFLGATTFCANLTGSADTFAPEDGPDLSFQYHQTDGKEELLRKLRELDAVDDAVFSTYQVEWARFDADALTDETRETNRSLYLTDGADLYVQVHFLSDDAFRALCAKNRLNADDFFDADDPRGVLWNRQERYVQGADAFETVPVLRADALPQTASLLLGYREKEGYTPYAEGIAERDGVRCIPYYPTDYLEGFGAGALDESKAVWEPVADAERRTSLTVGAFLEEPEYYMHFGSAPTVFYPNAVRTAVLGDEAERYTFFYFKAAAYDRAEAEIEQLLRTEGIATYVSNHAASSAAEKALVTVINVFSYGFIILISLIAMANVFNTVSTNVSLRRREFAMLRSVGMSRKGFRRMMHYECLLYGFRGLLYGLPLAFALCYGMYLLVDMDEKFYMPWGNVAVAVVSVFVVVAVTMLYATRRLRRDNPVETLRQENL